MVKAKTKFYLYYALFGILGGLVVIHASLTTSSDGFSIPLTLVFVGGSGMMLTAAYQMLTTEPSAFGTKNDTAGRDMVVLGSGALLALLGLALQLIN